MPIVYTTSFRFTRAQANSNFLFEFFHCAMALSLWHTGHDCWWLRRSVLVGRMICLSGHGKKKKNFFFSALLWRTAKKNIFYSRNIFFLEQFSWKMNESFESSNFEKKVSSTANFHFFYIPCVCLCVCLDAADIKWKNIIIEDFFLFRRAHIRIAYGTRTSSQSQMQPMSTL